MAGVVYSGSGNGSLGKFGLPISIAAGALIPPGQYISQSGWTAMVDGSPVTMPPGMVDSDGQATSAGGLLFPIGARQVAPWPWPLPWPLSAAGGLSARDNGRRPC